MVAIVTRKSSTNLAALCVLNLCPGLSVQNASPAVRILVLSSQRSSLFAIPQTRNAVVSVARQNKP